MLKNLKDLNVILKTTSSVSKIPVKLILSKNKTRKVVEARHAFMIVASKLTDFSSIKIGKHVNKDHATVLYAFKNEHIKNINILVRKIIKIINKFKRIISDIYLKAVNENESSNSFADKIIELFGLSTLNVESLNTNVNNSLDKIEYLISDKNVIIKGEINRIKQYLNDYYNFII